MVNTQIRQFRDSIIAMTNANPLPIEIKRLVFAEIQTQINAESDKIIIAERQEAEKQNKETEEREENTNEQQQFSKLHKNQSKQEHSEESQN